MWRWDQGRLLYFQFDVLKSIAKTLVKFENADISECENRFREALVAETGMPFLPDRYTIKRNYARVFQCSFLAGFAGNRLVLTDFCHALADPDGAIKDADDYFFRYIRKFRFPFPAFDGYQSAGQRVYPFCAILKRLIAKRNAGQEAKLSLDEIFLYIIANHCTGTEDIEFYTTLSPAPYTPSETERRQLREMIIFISQLSILKVHKGFLCLDEIGDRAVKELIEHFPEPETGPAKADRMEEFLERASLESEATVPALEAFALEPSDLEFIEGNKKRTEHFRVERSGLLKKYYKQSHPQPICSVCGTDMGKRYPWTDYLLEIHHLLPLSSSVAISSGGTSLKDIVGICPSCHRAIHLYYRKWLKENGQTDFRSKKDAYDVFLQAKKEISL